jgi:hypothetical protein
VDEKNLITGIMPSQRAQIVLKEFTRTEATQPPKRTTAVRKLTKYFNSQLSTACIFRVVITSLTHQQNAHMQ